MTILNTTNQTHDDILDAALNELGGSSSEEDEVDQMKSSSVVDDKTKDHVKVMEDAMKSLLLDADAEDDHNDGGVNKEVMDNTISKLLNGLNSQESVGNGDDIPDMDNLQVGEDIMEQMMNDFSKNMENNKGDFDDIVDGMMRQLLAKELMYEPMKNVCERFPVWLAESKDKLTEEDYIRYGTQYQYFQRIVAVYENDPDNYRRLQELMTEIQEFGQPPAEIIKDLAPGLDFDNNSFGQIPGMPDPASLFSGGSDGQPQCPTM